MRFRDSITTTGTPHEACPHCGAQYPSLGTLLGHVCPRLAPAPKRRNAAPERDVMRAIEQLCALHGVPVRRIGSGAMRVDDPAGGRRRYFRGGFKGAPDLVLLTARHGTVWCEVKSPTGRLSPEQADFAALCHRLGIPHVVARRVEDVLPFVAPESMDVQLTEPCRDCRGRVGRHAPDGAGIYCTRCGKVVST